MDDRANHCGCFKVALCANRLSNLYQSQCNRIESIRSPLFAKILNPAMYGYFEGVCLHRVHAANTKLPCRRIVRMMLEICIDIHPKAIFKRAHTSVCAMQQIRPSVKCQRSPKEHGISA